MYKPLSRVASALGTALVFGACNDATEPPAVAGSGGSGDDTHCVGTLPPGTYDNIIVPPGALCFLNNSVVRGNVRALEGARLGMSNDVVHGSIEGDKASSVQIGPSTVHGNIHIVEAHHPIFIGAFVAGVTLPNGNIHIEKGRFPFGDWVVSGNRLGKGNIKVEENGSTVTVNRLTFNNVQGNVQVFKNFGSGAKIVQANTVRENLQCKENTPPFIGTPNIVGGHAEDQCAGPGGMSGSSEDLDFGLSTLSQGQLVKKP